MGETVLSLIVKARDLTGGALKNLDARVRNTVGRIKRHFTTFRSSVLSVQTAMRGLAGAAGIGFVAKKTFDLGAEIEETASKCRTVFGSAVGVVNEQMDELARKAGLTDNEFRDISARQGDIVQGFGASEAEAAELATTMNTLAADMTSFNNVPMEETSHAVASALTGEREQLKRLGVVIRETDVQERALVQTGKERAEQLTQMEKAEATVALIRERMSKALGDLDRTADSNANTAKRLGAEWRQFRDVLAESAMPILGELLGVVDDQTSRLEKWTDFIENNQEVITAWAKVVVESVKFAVQSAVSALRIVFNAGQVIGSLISITVTEFMGHVSNLLNIVIDGVNMVLAGMDKLPGVDLDFRIERMPADKFFEASGRSLDQLKGDIEDGVDSVKDLASSWVAVRDASRQAEIAERRAARAAQEEEGGGDGGGGGEGGGRGIDPGEVSGSPFMTAQMHLDQVEGPGQLKEGIIEVQEEIETLEDATTSFGSAAGDAFGGALAGAVLASEGMKQGFLGSLAQMAAAKGKFYIAESLGALAQGILGDPKGFAAAKQYAVAAGAMFAVAGAFGGAAAAVSGGAGGGGGVAGAAGAGAQRQTEAAGQAAQPPAQIVVRGGFLDMTDPRQVRRFSSAMSEVSGRDVIITGGG